MRPTARSRFLNPPRAGAAALAAALLAPLAASGQPGDGAIRLIVRGDDFGYTHASNEGMVRAFDEGVMTSASLLVPGPWFAEAAALAKDRPEWSLGVHLTVTSEWGGLRWGPLAAAAEVPSLIAPDGRFWGWGYGRPQPDDLPAGSAPWATHAADPREVEVEFRAQIQQALRAGLRIDYVDCHMGIGCREDLMPVTRKLAEEYCLAISSTQFHGAQRFAPDYPSEFTPEGTRRALLDGLAKLGPGLHLYVGHPAVASPELKAVDRARGEYWHARRSSVLAAWTDPEVRASIERLGIELVPMRRFAPAECNSR